MTASILVCCGSGGVGKTTSSAALAVNIAREGLRVVVLTIDPAKRLADSLNIGEISGEPTRIPLENIDGECDAVMLDVTQTFIGLVEQFSTSSKQAERILNNRYFKYASTRLSGVHEYMAAEKVYELAASATYDVVVVDTPPSRNALEFLHAPGKLARLMDGSIVRWLSVPVSNRGWRAIELGGDAVSKVMHRVVGEQTTVEIAEFFDAFRGLWDGFQERSLAVQDMLRGPDATFLLVTSPASTSRDEALFFLDKLRSEQMPFAGFLVNRVQTAPVTIPSREDFPVDGPGRDWATTCDFVAQAPIRQAQLAANHQSSIDALQQQGPKDAKVWCIPDQGRPIHDLSALIGIGSHLPTTKDLF